MKKITISLITVSFFLLFILPKQGFSQACNNIATYAGTGADGSTDGTLATALFDEPRDIAIDKNGNIFVADGGNHTIRKITPGGTVSTFAGMAGAAAHVDATGTAARFNTPVSLVFDQNGNLYVADARNARIRKITPAGVVTTLAGNGVGFPAIAPGIGTAATIARPRFLTIDSQGNLYFTNNQNQIGKVTTSGAEVTLFAGSATGASGDVNGTGLAASFEKPSGLAVDAADNVYVVDFENMKIKKITSAGVVTTFAGTGAGGTTDGTTTTATFNYPRGITIDCLGNIYISQGTEEESTTDDAIRKITPDGTVSTIIGGLNNGDVDGIGSAAQVSGPRGMVVDAAGNLFIVDVENHKIKQIAACTSNCIVTPPIPTLSQWGLLIFVLLMLNLGILILYSN